ncbi:hypothetical protein ABTQ09_15520 [Acinetobacter baumannii]|uniref:hypothetical protein n=2 Tax=Gammaproteobacteria TaxID=1236 RepID=UPI00035584F0|nr:hypothetical protein [Acinetobacter baumannii]AGQ06673.1 hypothetical protein BJAB0715_02027 [Acinetobacter baumannii BJAB0715]AMN01601.1 hypothetical protein AZE33_10455 [Acinetobacter baumannii]MDB0262125.1 hypothetical protein [Acinetobacter baumannii]MDB0305744.1 hypothetical protein [Acinetobacter baumannii]MVO49865.1 hypothetical protein [Acinetobacter baumannii]
MKNINLFIIVSSCLSFIGCVTADSIRPSDVKAYKTPNNLILAKSLNGKDGNGKEYLFQPAVPDALIPHSYMSNLCTSQEGRFFQMSKSDFRYLKGTHISALDNQSLASAMGTFKCASKKSWNVSIEPTSSRIGGINQPLNLVTLKTFVISDDDVYSNVAAYQSKKNIEDNMKKQAIEQYKLEQQQLKNKYERNLITNAPKPKDIGQTICKNTGLSEFTGTIILGQATYRQVDGLVIASLEGFSNDHTNLKINVKGWLNNFNQISSGLNVLYKQTPLESGRVVWDDKQGWYKCHY